MRWSFSKETKEKKKRKLKITITLLINSEYIIKESTGVERAKVTL